MFVQTVNTKGAMPYCTAPASCLHHIYRRRKKKISKKAATTVTA